MRRAYSRVCRETFEVALSRVGGAVADELRVVVFGVSAISDPSSAFADCNSAFCAKDTVADGGILRLVRQARGAGGTLAGHSALGDEFQWARGAWEHLAVARTVV